MKTKNYFSILLITAVSFLIGTSLAGCSNVDSPKEPELKSTELDEIENSIQDFACIRDYPMQPLSEDETAGLLFMREEEKLARDVYIYLSEFYPLPVLKNISKSEQRHMDAIKYLLDRYEIEDPVGEDIQGSFKNEHLQKLYDQLIEAGKVNRVEALKAGALIEETDILDLQDQISEKVDNKDITHVYSNLLKGSYHHLKAFTGVLKVNGIIYEPVLMEKEDFDKILGN